MKYFLIAGEASGDLHSANLIRAIKAQDKEALFTAWGGDLMQKQGAVIRKHYRDLAFMGFAEVLMNLRTILRNFRLCKEHILEAKPDAVILVDYPGFNLRMAEWLHKRKIPVLYYISPQVWAWKQSRVKKIKAFVDKMFVILPFEASFYARFDYTVDFVGHPLLDAVNGYKASAPDREILFRELSPEGKPIVALLPGSRKQEVSLMLPGMLKMIDRFPDYHFVVAEASSLDPAFFEELYQGRSVGRLRDRTYDLLSVSKAVAVTSGTACLETSLFGVPGVICYKANALSFQIAKRIVNIAYIGLPNLIMDRSIVKELIQDEMNVEALEKELFKLLNDVDYRAKMENNLEELREVLGGPGASDRTARLIIEYMNAIN